MRAFAAEFNQLVWSSDISNIPLLATKFVLLARQLDPGYTVSDELCAAAAEYGRAVPIGPPTTAPVMPAPIFAELEPDEPTKQFRNRMNLIFTKQCAIFQMFLFQVQGYRQVTAVRNEGLHGALESELTKASGFVALFTALNRLTDKHYDVLYSASRKAQRTPNLVPAGFGRSGLVAALAERLSPWVYSKVLEEVGLAKDGEYEFKLVCAADQDNTVKRHAQRCLGRHNQKYSCQADSSMVLVYSCTNTSQHTEKAPFNMVSIQSDCDTGALSNFIIRTCLLLT